MMAYQLQSWIQTDFQCYVSNRMTEFQNTRVCDATHWKVTFESSVSNNNNNNNASNKTNNDENINDNNTTTYNNSDNNYNECNFYNQIYK